MVRSRAVLILALTAAWCVDGATAAQTPAVPTFEAASVKPNSSGGPRSGTGIMPGGHVTITNQTLRQIIRSAYGSEDIEVLGGPDWIGTDRWDIVATAGTGSADPPWRLMLKSLLTERFLLQAHSETRERPIFSLVLARGDKQLGPGIHPSLADLACGANDLCGSTQANTNGIASGVITGSSRSMANIAQSLSRYAERRVVDRTGLEGRYDFELRWSDVSIFTALQEQLGLKLEPTKGPVDVVVIDHAERPTEN